MKKIRVLFITILSVTLLFSAVCAKDKDIYYCPMHPGFTADKPGDCAICGMKLVKKDVHEDHVQPAEPSGSGVYISSERQQLIGVKKEKAIKRHLEKTINATGRVAYNPELYVAQQEYLQTLKTMGLNSSESRSLVEASYKKLLLLGMSKVEIEALANKKKADENLYLPLDSDTAWVYMTIYEQDINLIKEGLSVEVEALAYPGEEFKGKVSAITPVLDNITRSLEVRSSIADPQHKLKPQMYVDAKLLIDLGEKVSIPEEAVLDTGERKVVFIAKADGYFAQREVKLGYKANGFYEVLEGISEGEEVVTSGNFLIDSESKLKTAIGHENIH